MTLNHIDLDAARREAGSPDGIPLTLRDEEFLLPAELPEACLDPLLDERLGLFEAIKQAVENDQGGGSVGADVVNLLTARPDLPREVLSAIRGVFALLFGPDEFSRFQSLRPSLPDYLRMIKALTSLYGVSLGEAWRSLASSESDGATSKPTSSSTTTSTPEASSAGPTSPAS